MKPGTEKELKRTSRLHLTRCVELYRAQMRDGLFFLHEYPGGCSSVFEDCLQDFLRTPGVFQVKSDVFLGHDVLGLSGRGPSQEGNLLGDELSTHR